MIQNQGFRVRQPFHHLLFGQKSIEILTGYPIETPEATARIQEIRRRCLDTLIDDSRSKGVKPMLLATLKMLLKKPAEPSMHLLSGRSLNSDLEGVHLRARASEGHVAHSAPPTGHEETLNPTV